MLASTDCARSQKTAATALHFDTYDAVWMGDEYDAHQTTPARRPAAPASGAAGSRGSLPRLGRGGGGRASRRPNLAGDGGDQQPPPLQGYHPPSKMVMEAEAAFDAELQARAATISMLSGLAVTPIGGGECFPRVD
jgi:hypothetical protein